MDAGWKRSSTDSVRRKQPEERFRFTDEDRVAPPLWLSEQPEFGSTTDAGGVGSLSFFEDGAASSWWDGTSSGRKNPTTRQQDKNQQPEEITSHADDNSFNNPIHRPQYPPEPPKPKIKGKGSSRQKGNRFRPEEPSSYEKPSHPVSSGVDSYDQVGAIPEYYAPESLEKSPIRKRPSLLKADSYTESGYADPASAIPEYYAPESLEKSPIRKRPSLLKADSYPESGYADPASEIPEYYAPEAVEKSPIRKKSPPLKLDTYPESGYPDQLEPIPEYYAPESTGKSPSRKRRPPPKSETYSESRNPDQLGTIPEYLSPELIEKSPSRKKSRQPPPKLDPYPEYSPPKSTKKSAYHKRPQYPDAYPEDYRSQHPASGDYDKYETASGNKPYNSKTPSYSDFPEYFYEEPLDGAPNEPSHPAQGHHSGQLPELTYKSADPESYQPESSQKAKRPLKQELNSGKENTGYAESGPSDPFSESGAADYFHPELIADAPKWRRKPLSRPHPGKKASGKPQHDFPEELPLPDDHVMDASLPDRRESILSPLSASSFDDIKEIAGERQVPSGNQYPRRRRPSRPKIQPPPPEFNTFSGEDLNVRSLFIFLQI